MAVKKSAAVLAFRCLPLFLRLAERSEVRFVAAPRSKPLPREGMGVGSELDTRPGAASDGIRIWKQLQIQVFDL